MEAIAAPRLCLACGKKLNGRIDKKFCDDYCRNNYNNQLKSRHSLSPAVRNISNALLKNHRILSAVLKPGEEMHKVPRERLLEAGFSFRYHTHIYYNKKNEPYYFVFDHAWLELDNGWYLIVRRKEKEEG